LWHSGFTTASQRSHCGVTVVMNSEIGAGEMNEATTKCAIVHKRTMAQSDGEV
jgi:hypothetical protein